MKTNLRLILLLPLFFLTSVGKSQGPGCTDPLATNYNASATINDGSCVYANTSILPVSSMTLPSLINETSGLALMGDSVWTHNDNNDIRLFRFDVNDTAGMQAFPLNGVSNIDWEEITADSQYFYVGDFGNNLNGARTNLRILRIEKQSLFSGNPTIDTIQFSYSDQIPVTPVGGNITDFDCEAMVADQDSIYLFSKMWTTQKTTVYSLPKIPGVHTANRKFQVNVQGLITGATMSDSGKVVVLCGYSSTLQPFVYLLYDYPGKNFLLGNKRKININLPFHQIEGITTADGLTYYCSNEKFIQSVINVAPKLHNLNLNPFLGPYITTSEKSLKSQINVSGYLFPNPSTDKITLKLLTELNGTDYMIYDQQSRLVLKGRIKGSETCISLEHLMPGYYFLQYGDQDLQTIKLLKSE